MKRLTKQHNFQPRTLVIIFGGILVAGAIVASLANREARAYPANCNETCQAAYDRALEASNRAAEANEQADTLEAVVAQLNEEIAAIEYEIQLNQERANEISAELEVTQEKLDTQQAALAKMLINMHFDSDNDSIKILAGSKSLGDLAERQARQAAVKAQISSSALKIKDLKLELQQQKEAVEVLIANSEASRAEAGAKRAEQAALMEKYKDDAEAYAADAIAARQEMYAAIAEQTALYNSTGSVGDGVNTYPRAANCPRDNIQYLFMGGYVCQCTSYASWKAYETWGVTTGAWGDAKAWVNNYSNSKSAVDIFGQYHSYRIDQTPAANTIGITTGGIYGHVVWIESVNSNGTVNLSEYNNSWSSASGLPGDFGVRIGVSTAGMYFIHFDQPIY